MLAATAVAAVAAGLHGYADGPPPGHTGGFGEPTCAECHRDAAAEPGGVRLAVEGLPERYRPGERYALTVRLQAPELRRGGFQLAVRCLSGRRDGAQAGSLRGGGARVEVVTGGPTSDGAEPVAYAQQTLDGSLAGNGAAEPGVLSWRVEWTAPPEGRGCGGGPVAVDVAANASNDDASEFGDRVVSERAAVHGPCETDGPSGT